MIDNPDEEVTPEDAAIIEDFFNEPTIHPCETCKGTGEDCGLPCLACNAQGTDTAFWHTAVSRAAEPLTREKLMRSIYGEFDA